MSWQPTLHALWLARQWSPISSQECRPVARPFPFFCLPPAPRCTFDDPYGGQCSDTFELGAGGDTLTQHTDMTINGRGRTQYRTVYNRMHQG